MKKLLMVSLLIGSVLLFGVATQAYALNTADLIATYGAAVALPIASPTAITVGGATTGSVDFAVLQHPVTLIYSYFYQIDNLGGGLGAPIGRFTFDNPLLFPLLGSGIMADGLESVVLDTLGPFSFGADLDPIGLGGNKLRVTDGLTNRFFFQFSGAPGVVPGYLIDGGIGSGPVVGPVPEPASLLLLGSGLLGLAAFGRARKRKV